MRAIPKLAVLALVAGLTLPASAESTCGTFGTALEWAASPTAAAQLAKEQHKLVFVMHISGNFARPEFT